MVNKNLVMGGASQKSMKGARHAATVSYQVEGLPLEISLLLDVFSRIEARRQAKLRTVGKE